MNKHSLVSPEQVAEVEKALEKELSMVCDPNDPDGEQGYGTVERCYGIALALGIINDTSTDEELDRIIEKHGWESAWARA